MKLVFATNNEHKIKEIQSIISPEIQILSLKDIGCFEDIEETAPTIEGNAIIKAQYIKQKYGYNAFADDTGLEVKALNNAPGVYSARYAGTHKNDFDNIQLLLKNMEQHKDREAQFKTIIALCWEAELHTFEGIVKGQITTSIKGEKGFGYDPIFQPNGNTQTFAQMEASEKNKISHRAIAIKQLIKFLSTQKM